MRSEAEIDHAIDQQKTGPLQLLGGVEKNIAVAVVVVASARSRGLDQYRATEFLLSGGDVECVQAIILGAVVVGIGDHVHGVGVGIDYRGAGDSVLRLDVDASGQGIFFRHLVGRNGGDIVARVDEAGAPERLPDAVG